MNKKSNLRNRSIHLYNPKEEGIGSYDVNYINAYRKEKSIKHIMSKKTNERLIA
tara:strand:+ start:1082 stop:1243 length:162 start_codon:yes stop_codon:yes gene_type:complete